MNAAACMEKLRKQMSDGISVYGLDAMAETCTQYLRTESQDAGGLFASVFALRGVIVHIRETVDDEGFPDSDRLAAVEQKFWPMLDECLDELSAEVPSVHNGHSLPVLNRTIRSLFSP